MTVVPADQPLVGYAWVPLGARGVRGRRGGASWSQGRGAAVCPLHPGDLGPLLEPGHPMPAAGCACGIALAVCRAPTLPASPMLGSQVAVVAGWGRTAVRRAGVRCEHGEVLAVYAGQGRVARWWRSTGLAGRQALLVGSAEALEAVLAQHAAGHRALLEAVDRRPTPIPLAFDPSRPAARHRFVLEGSRGRIKHSGTLRLPELYEGEEPVAIGEISTAVERPVASFTYVTDGWREAAERVLRRWAALDGWPGIEIRLGVEPLAVRTFRERVPAVAGAYYAQWPFHFRPGRPLPSTGVDTRGRVGRRRSRRWRRGNP